MIYIRTDANEEVATGHIMRCKTIAKKIKEIGEEVKFIVRDESSVEMLQGQFGYILLKSEPGHNFDKELLEIKEILECVEQAKVLLDLYMFDAEYMQSIKKYAKVITFDDTFEEKYPADIIVNYNLYYDIFDYKKRYKDSETKLLLGGKYVPVREEFCVKNEKNISEVRNILLISGGGDTYHFLYNLIRRICHQGINNRYTFHIVAGRLNKDTERLKVVEAQNENVIIYENVNEMAKLMRKMDIIVSAAGTVLFECCKMAIPTIFFCMADNQKYVKEGFAKNDMMEYVGDIRYDMEEVFERLINKIDELANDIECRENMRQLMEKVLDGKGAERIASEIVNL